MSDIDLRQRFRATILGAVLGDCLGAPYEFKAPDQIAAMGGVDDTFHESVFGHPAGAGTDDSELTRVLGDSLVAVGGYSQPDHARRLVEWYDGNPLDVGARTSDSIVAWKFGEAPTRRDSAQGNGSLMAISPLALMLTPATAVCRPESQEFGAILGAYTATTHFAVDCLLANQWMVYAYSATLLGCLAEPTVRHDRQLFPPPKGTGRFEAATMGWCWNSAHIAFSSLALAERRLRVASSHGKALSAEEVTALGGTDPETAELVWSVLRHVVSLGGDTDTNASIAGAFLGFAFGSWPERMLEQLPELTSWLELADDLYELACRFAS